MISKEAPTDPQLLKKLYPKTCGSQLANTLKMDEMTLVSRCVAIPT